MNALRKHLFIVLSTLLVLIAGSLFVEPQQAHADTDYQNETLVGDLGLPQEVVGVMIKNSLDANGNTPSVSATSVTVGNISQWQTVSLANRKQNADGSYTSSTNATVAAWFAGLKTSSDNQVETQDMILYQDMSENQSTTTPDRRCWLMASRPTMATLRTVQLICPFLTK